MTNSQTILGRRPPTGQHNDRDMKIMYFLSLNIMTQWLRQWNLKKELLRNASISDENRDNGGTLHIQAKDVCYNTVFEGSNYKD